MKPNRYDFFFLINRKGTTPAKKSCPKYIAQGQRNQQHKKHNTGIQSSAAQIRKQNNHLHHTLRPRTNSSMPTYVGKENYASTHSAPENVSVGN